MLFTIRRNDRQLLQCSFMEVFSVLWSAFATLLCWVPHTLELPGFGPFFSDLRHAKDRLMTIHTALCLAAVLAELRRQGITAMNCAVFLQGGMESNLFVIICSADPCWVASQSLNLNICACQIAPRSCSALSVSTHGTPGFWQQITGRRQECPLPLATHTCCLFWLQIPWQEY